MGKSPIEWLENVATKLSRTDLGEKHVTTRVWDYGSVIYTSGDSLSFFLAIVSLVPPILVIWSLASFYTAPRIGKLAFIIAMFINEVINLSLKKLFRIPRPVNELSQAGFMEARSYGMPSSHAQFALCSLVFFYAQRTELNALSVALRYSKLKHCFFFCLACAILLSRVYNRHHTVAQVAAGSFIGVAVGYALQATGIAVSVAQRCFGLFWK